MLEILSYIFPRSLSCNHFDHDASQAPDIGLINDLYVLYDLRRHVRQAFSSIKVYFPVYRPFAVFLGESIVIDLSDSIVTDLDFVLRHDQNVRGLEILVQNSSIMQIIQCL